MKLTFVDESWEKEYLYWQKTDKKMLKGSILLKIYRKIHLKRWENPNP